jgi:hypothetical protein
MIGMRYDVSWYVKNMDSVIRKAGTIHASAVPRKNRTTKSPAKF